jgi:hypothetical protein
MSEVGSLEKEAEPRSGISIKPTSQSPRQRLAPSMTPTSNQIGCAADAVDKRTGHGENRS